MGSKRVGGMVDDYYCVWLWLRKEDEDDGKGREGLIEMGGAYIVSPL